jgi:hypothetical protein
MNVDDMLTITTTTTTTTATTTTTDEIQGRKQYQTLVMKVQEKILHQLVMYLWDDYQKLNAKQRDGMELDSNRQGEETGQEEEEYEEEYSENFPADAEKPRKRAQTNKRAVTWEILEFFFCRLASNNLDTRQQAKCVLNNLLHQFHVLLLQQNQEAQQREQEQLFLIVPSISFDFSSTTLWLLLLHLLDNNNPLATTTSSYQESCNMQVAIPWLIRAIRCETDALHLASYLLYLQHLLISDHNDNIHFTHYQLAVQFIKVWINTML